MAAADEKREPIIRIRGLRNQFGTQVVHDNLDMDVYPGEIIGLVGGSGSGKSVLLRSILGLHEPNAGSIKLYGEEVLAMDERERARLQARSGVLFQNGALFSSLSVLENVMVPMREHFDLSDELMMRLAAIKVAMAGLPADAGPKLPSELSGGMVKRAALARALALDPQIVFLDEPTAGLDPIGASAFDQLTLTLRNSLGLTVFLITHDLDTLYTICDRVAVLAEQHLLVNDSLGKVQDFPNPWVQQYFRGPRARAAAAASHNPHAPEA